MTYIHCFFSSVCIGMEKQNHSPEVTRAITGRVGIDLPNFRNLKKDLDIQGHVYL